MQKYISSIRGKIILISIGLGILFWIADSFIDVFMFHDGTVVSQLFTPGPYEIYVRLLNLSILLLFGFISQYLISRYMQATESLRESEKRYRTLAEAAQDMIFIIDRNDNVQYVNTIAAKQFGRRPEELIGRKREELFPSEVSRQQQHLQKVFETGKAIYAEDRIVFPNNELWIGASLAPLINDAGKVEAVMGISRDITELKKTEEMIKATVQQWQTTFDAMNDGIFIADAKGTILRCNMAFANFVNRKESEIVGHTCHEVVHGTADFMNGCPFIAAKDTRHREVTELRAGNKWLYVTVDPILNDSGEVVSFVHAISDITKRKQFEEALKESESKYRMVVENINEIIYKVSFKEEPLKGVVEFISDQTEKIIGYQFNDFSIDTGLWFKIVHPDDRSSVAQLTQEMVKNKKAVTRYYRLRHKITAEYLWMEDKVVPMIDGNNNVIGCFGVSRDITGRKSMEEQLFQIKQDWEDTFNIITDMITVHDKDFNIIHANKAAEKILGLPFLDVSPSKCYRYYHGTGGPPEGCPGCECLKTGLSSMNEIYEPHLKMFIEIRAIPRFDNSNNLTGLIHVVRDITERRKLEDQLRQSQKMEAIGQLAGGIAHDFNNILTAVIGYATILKMRMGKDEPLKVNLDQILAASEKGANLTQSLLAFSRQQISNPEPVNVNEQIRSMEKLLLRVIGEDIELKIIQNPPTPPLQKGPACPVGRGEGGFGDLTVMADHVQMDQVLINLCTNARDAMPDGGVLTIETGRMELDREFITAYGYGKPGTYAVISVSDTGIGIDKKIRDRIFEPFYTTKEVGRGTGLGLSIVYGIIKQHNGYITCNSEPGKGSTFKIYLPIIKSEITEIKSEENPELESETATILLAEDELSVRILTKQVLENFGYSVIEAADGEEAVRKFMENRDRIDIIILDVIMPKMNGKEVYDRIRKIRPDIKALLTSGYPADFIQKEEIIKQGINFVAKPISPAGLLKKVKETLGK